MVGEVSIAASAGIVLDQAVLKIDVCFAGFFSKILRMLRDFLTDPFWLAIAAWLAVILATLALTPQVVGLGWWLRKRWQKRGEIETQSKKDRSNYASLLKQYQDYLDILENLIVLRSQIEAGPDEFTPELKQKLMDTRDRVYDSLEESSDREEDMGIFQKLDILEGRMVGIVEERRKRADLEVRQAEIESHRLFI